MARGKYTVNEVEERSKVPASTLRQWERRYGFPKPERSSSGYRLYSDMDIANIEAMKRHIADGIPASRAAELVKRREISVESPRSLPLLGEELVAAFVEFDEDKADAIFNEAHALYTVEVVMLELIQPVLTDIGQRWHKSDFGGNLGIATECFASNYIYGRLRALLNISRNSHSSKAVLVACAPGEHHELEALMLAVLLQRTGYRVYYLGANTPFAAIDEMAAALSPAAIMISASTLEVANQLKTSRRMLADMAPVVTLGGAAFDKQPELAKLLGGQYLAPNIREAAAQFHGFIATAERAEESVKA